MTLGAVRPSRPGRCARTPGDRAAGERRQAVGTARVDEPVAGARGVPDAPVQVRAAASLVGERLGRERRDQAAPRRDAADGLAVGDLVVGGPQCRGVPGRQLLLPPAELRVRQLDRQALARERRDDVLDDVLGRVHPDRAEAQAAIDGLVAGIGPDGEVELVLERGLEREAGRGSPLLHALQEPARVEGPGRVVELDHVHEHLAAARRVGQDRERLRVRDEPDLADGPVGRVRRERVDARERLHALHEADARLHPPGERRDVRALAAHDAAVVAVQEAHELEALGLGLGDDLLGCHRACLAGCGLGASTAGPGACPWTGGADRAMAG